MASGGRLRWVFELLDKMSGPTRRIDGALSRATQSLKGFKRGLDAVQLDAFVNLAGRAWSALEGIGRTFGDVVIGNLAFKESTMASFEMMLGTKEAAKGLFTEAAKLAKLTPFGTKDVVESYAGLLGAGFKAEEVGVLFQGLSDIASLSDFDPAGMKAITMQLAQMKGKGKLLTEDLKPILSVSSKAGIGLEAINAQLAKDLGTSPQAVAAMQSSGEISADQFIYSFMKAIATRGGGQLGNITKTQSETLKGLWQNLKSVPDDVVFGFAENLKGIEVLKGAMKSVIGLFDAASPSGKRFLGVVERITDSLLTGLFGPFAGARGEEFFGTQMEKFLSWAEKKDWGATFTAIGEGVSKLTTAIELFVKVAGAAVTVAETLAKPLTSLSAAVGAHKKDAFVGYAAPGSTFDEQGRLITGGVAKGMALSADQVYRQAIDLAQGVRGAFAGPQGIDAHSPSRVFEELGRFSGEGYALGISKSAGEVSASLSELLPGGAKAAGQGGGGVVHVHEGAFPIVVQGGGNAEEVARQLRPALLREVVGLFETLGMEVGVEGATS